MKIGGQGYFARLYGKCAKSDHCVFKVVLSGEMLCQDDIGGNTINCCCYIKPTCVGKISWTTGFHNWSEIEKIYKESRNAYFALPVIKCDGEYTVGDVKDFKDNTLGIKGVIYTTREQIEKVYGRPEFYLSSVLTKVFRKELLEMT
ncbi:MAG: hypothetical protein M0P26_00125 [Bacteroidales bacterium]|nr:hypothetical protein [Bacteroidales bacterium]